MEVSSLFVLEIHIGYPHVVQHSNIQLQPLRLGVIHERQPSIRPLLSQEYVDSVVLET